MFIAHNTKLDKKFEVSEARKNELLEAKKSADVFLEIYEITTQKNGDLKLAKIKA